MEIMVDNKYRAKFLINDGQKEFEMILEATDIDAATVMAEELSDMNDWKLQLVEERDEAKQPVLRAPIPRPRIVLELL